MAFALLLAAQAVPLRPNRDSELDSHFAAAQQAQRDKDYATAEREYRAVLAIAPDFAEVYMNLGLIYQLQDRLRRGDDGIPPRSETQARP